jgi:hypothetical protein
MSCKEWIAEVYDSISSCDVGSIDTKKLQSLLSEGERLSFRYIFLLSFSQFLSCVVEENQLKRCLKDLERICDEGKKVIEKLRQTRLSGMYFVPFS